MQPGSWTISNLKSAKQLYFHCKKCVRWWQRVYNLEVVREPGKCCGSLVRNACFQLPTYLVQTCLHSAEYDAGPCNASEPRDASTPFTHSQLNSLQRLGTGWEGTTARQHFRHYTHHGFHFHDVQICHVIACCHHLTQPWKCESQNRQHNTF